MNIYAKQFMSNSMHKHFTFDRNNVTMNVPHLCIKHVLDYCFSQYTDWLHENVYAWDSASLSSVVECFVCSCVCNWKRALLNTNRKSMTAIYKIVDEIAIKSMSMKSISKRKWIQLIKSFVAECYSHSLWLEHVISTAQIFELIMIDVAVTKKNKQLLKPRQFTKIY